MKKPRATTEMSPFGQRLDKAMKFAGIDQTELGRRVKLPQSTLSSAMAQKSSRSNTVLALACGVDPYWLETGDGPMVAAPTVAPASPAATGNTHRETIERAGKELAAMLDEAQRVALMRLMDAMLENNHLADSLDARQVIKWCSAPLPVKSPEIEIPGFISRSLPTQLDTSNAGKFDERSSDANRDGEIDQPSERPGGQQRPTPGG